MTAPADERSTHTHRVFPCPSAALFDAFRDPARLARWWGPAGFTNTFETYELREGAPWRFTMHGPDGTDYLNECLITEVIENRRFAMRHVVAPVFDLVVDLTALEGPAQGHTRLDWLQRFETPEMLAKVMAIVGPANEQNLDRLAAELARPPA